MRKHVNFIASLPEHMHRMRCPGHFPFYLIIQALAASQSDHDDGKGEGISAARGLQAYWSCRLGEPAMDIFVAKFSRCLGPGCVDIVVLGERTLFTLREQGTVRLQKILGYQPACGCKYAVTAAPGEEGARVMGTTVDEASMAFSTVVEEENVIIAADTDHLLVYKVRGCVCVLVTCTPVDISTRDMPTLRGRLQV